MKLLLGATAAVCLLASPAFAQTETQATATRCAGSAAAPAATDGATATRAQMEAAQAQWAAWQTQRLEQEAACQAEIAALTAAFNAAGPERAAAVAAFNAEVQEFSQGSQAAATPERRRRDGGVRTRPDH